MNASTGKTVVFLFGFAKTVGIIQLMHRVGWSIARIFEKSPEQLVGTVIGNFITIEAGFQPCFLC